MELEFSQYIFGKSSNIKFHQNLFSGSQVVPCARTNITKLTVAFHSFVNMPKNVLLLPKLKTKLHGAESFLRSLNVLSYSRNSPHFMEPEGSSPYTQEPATCPYPEPDQSSVLLRNQPLEDPF
jgi:hypothetical protein